MLGAESATMASDRYGFEDGFLAGDCTLELEVDASKVEGFLNALRDLKVPPDAIKVVPSPDGRAVVEATYFKGTPEQLFNAICGRIDKLLPAYQ